MVIGINLCLFNFPDIIDSPIFKYWTANLMPAACLVRFASFTATTRCKIVHKEHDFQAPRKVSSNFGCG